MKEKPNQDPKQDLVNLLIMKWDKASTMSNSINGEVDYFNALYGCLLLIIELEFGKNDNIVWERLWKTENSIEHSLKVFVWNQHMLRKNDSSFPDYFETLMKYSPIKNTVSGEVFHIKEKDSPRTIFEIVRIIKDVIEYDKDRSSIPTFPSYIGIVNMILQGILRESMKRYNPKKDFYISGVNMSNIAISAYFYFLLFLAFIFIYLFGGLFLKPEKGGRYENCQWQYTQDNIVCY